MIRNFVVGDVLLCVYSMHM